MSRRRPPRLVAWNAIAVATTGSLTVALVLSLAVLLGRGDRADLGLLLVMGGLPVLVGAGTAAVLGHWLSGSLGRLRAYAVAGLSGPVAAHPGSSRRAPLTVIDELAELTRTLDALHVRVRVADDVAGGHRHTAEAASAGMYELLSGLAASEEGSRGQLAAELHDTVAQSLVAARGMLLATPEPDTERVRDLVAEAEDQLRAVMSRTRPPALVDDDLAAAVMALCDDLELRYGLRVTLTWPDTARPIPMASAVTVYRFLQEALLNVVKHADCDVVEAQLHLDGDGLTAAVRDRGPGFDPGQVRSERGRHVGLALLRERARLAGGGMTVLSAVGSGTTLTLDLPRGLLVAGRSVPVAG